jgi:hypothetical protein
MVRGTTITLILAYQNTSSARTGEVVGIREAVNQATRVVAPVVFGTIGASREYFQCSLSVAVCSPVGRCCCVRSLSPLPRRAAGEGAGRGEGFEALAFLANLFHRQFLGSTSRA